MKAIIEKQKSNLKKEVLEVGVKSLLFALVAGVLTGLVHMICSRYILHIHGKPEFMSTALTIYSGCDKILMAVGYYILGRKIPIKNAILRGLSYMGLHWISNFLPQFMGLAFADGAIAQVAFRVSDLVCDSLVMLILGILLGILYRAVPEVKMRRCNNFGKVIVMSAILFTALVVIADQTMYHICPAFSSAGAIQVSEQARVGFFINFYSWFLLSGAFFAVFYRLTEYNDSRSWVKFGLKYSLLLWTPVVMIMVLFGTNLITTTVYALVFIVCIMVVCWINGNLMK